MMSSVPLAFQYRVVSNWLPHNELWFLSGLKVYSDWPTYPQLYANGELIGGVDIVRQLAETNELKAALGM